MRTGSAHAVDGIERALGRVAAASAQIHNHLPGFDAAQLFYGFAYGMLGGEAADNDCVGVVAVQPLHQAVAHMLASVVKTGTVQNAVGFDAVVVIGGVGQAAEQAVTLQCCTYWPKWLSLSCKKRGVSWRWKKLLQKSCR